MKRLVTLMSCAVSLGATAQTVSEPYIFYQSDFSQNDFDGWSSTQTIQYDNRTLLGNFGNETCSLTLTCMPPHTELKLSFDLYALDTWDGNGSANVEDYPDLWDPDLWFSSIDGSTLIETTFGHASNNPQSYPDNYPSNNPRFAGAVQQSLIYFCYGQDGTTAQYSLSFTIEHSVASAEIIFGADLLQDLCDESWALGNVAVSLNGSPVAMGCTDSLACNYNFEAACDDGSCLYLPAVDLGEDIGTCEESVILNAGAGYNSYLWSTGDTTQILEVSQAGQYFLQVESGVSGNLYSADFGIQANCGFGNTWVDCGQVFESNGSFSVGGWLFNNGCDYTTIVSQRPGGSCTDPYYGPGPYNGFHLSYENAGQFEFRLHQNSNGSNPIEPSVTTPAVEGSWVHLVGVFESGQSVKLFLNGEVVDSQSTSIEALDFCDYPFLIGSLQHGGNWSWDGKLDDVFAYSRALSDAEVLAVYESSFPSDGLSGLWQFEEGEGGVAYDASGNGNHGAVTGATWSTHVPYSADNWILHHVENFDGEIGLEWNTTESTTHGGNGVLGKFGENAHVLGTFSELPTHTQIEVGFDLYVIDSWDGNYGGVDGPDQWFFEIDEQQLISTTFANNPNANNHGGQSYPSDGASTFNPIQTGASLLLSSSEGPDCCDCGYHTSVYHIKKVVNHNSDSVTLHFSDSLSQSTCDESWAIDNVKIRVKNSPVCWLSDSISVDFFSSGCIDDYACNYDVNAQCDDGSCDYSCCPGPGCCDQGLTWNWELSLCQDLNPADINFDGCVQLNDLLDLLSAYGDCGAEESACQGEATLNYNGYEYELVEIGSQCWFAENLRSVAYNNGEAITSVFSYGDWSNTTSGATITYGVGGDNNCYDYSPDGDACDEVWSLDQYGRLYNWFAVDDARNLCPAGWHVPSDDEWTTLVDFLGGALEAGFALKSTSGFEDGGNGTNSSGFSGLPGGRCWVGSFDYAGRSGLWWSSTSNGSEAWFRELGSAYNGVNRDDYNRGAGLSVRCIKD